MTERPGLILRFVSSFLLLTSVGVTVVLAIAGYQLAIWMLEGGLTTGHMSIVVMAATPSVCALLSLPFWLTLRRMTQQV